MPSLTPIRSEMFPELRDGVLRTFNPDIPASVWERAFTSRGDSDEPNGYALTVKGSIVGLLGMIFSRRQIGETETRFCNLHTWYVQPEYRMSSLTLMKPLTEMRDCTITDFSATREVRAISRRMGFTDLDRAAVVLRPLLWGRGTREAELTEVNDENLAELGELSPAEVAIFRDHRDVDCGHLLVRDEDGYCYVVYSRITHGMLPGWLVSCQVHHVSDPRRFARHHAAIRAQLIRHSGGRCVVVDARLLNGVQIPNSVRVQANPKIYRSPNVRPAQIDNLYSELAYFKFSTLPTLKTMIKSAAQSCVPSGLRKPAPAGS